MTPTHNNRSEYGRTRGADYIRPDDTPRALSTSERARLMRSAGMHPAVDPGPGSPEAPQEFGERLA